MKKKLISLGVSIVLGVVAVGMVPTTIKADNEPTVSITKVSTDKSEELAHGSDGEAEWSLTADGILHVFGGEAVADGVSFATGMDDSFKPLVTKFVFEGKTIAQNSTANFFSGFKNLQEIDGLNNLDTSNTANMNNMFDGLTKLKTVDLSQLNVSNAVNISNIFSNSGLESVDVADWDVRNVKYASSILANSQIKSLDISNWQVDSLISAMSMFAVAPNLTSLKMFKDFKNIESVNGMFFQSNIKNLDASGWNMSNVKDASVMFAGASIETLDASNWNLSNVSGLTGMFAQMPNLKSLDVSNWQLTDVVSMDQMFLGDTSLRKLDLSTWHDLGSSFTGGLAFTGITQLKVSADTELNDSYFGAKENEEGDIETDEEGIPLYEGYLVKVGAPATELIKASDLATGFEGIYNYVNPTEITAKVTVESNRGNQTTDATVNGDLTQEVDVAVPEISGATADKATVKGVVVATTDENENTIYSIKVTDPKGAGYVTYTGGDTGGSGGSGGGSNSSNKPEVTNVKRLVSVHADKGEARLYQQDTTKVEDRALASGSDWFSDQQMVKNGETYYRVATNEWVKASDTYVYESHSGVIGTGSDNYQELTNSRGNTVSDRALAASSAWKIDRLAYINGDQYYRVATNEFVPVDSVSKL